METERMKHWQVEPQKDGFGGQKRGEATMKNNKRHHHSDGSMGKFVD
jgi:hypothetical protein